MSTIRPRVVVVGGANADIVGRPDRRFALRDSNPGHVGLSAGGVGRNIAENLARLGASVRLVTAFGGDEVSRWLAAECEESGIDTSYSLTVPDAAGSRYLAVLDAAGDLAAAVNDMRVLERLTPDALDAAAFEGAHAIVLDTNVQASTIARVAELAAGVPLVLDPVSTAKAPQALPIIGRLSALKANLREAEELSGAAGAEGAAARLIEAGVGWVFVTMGAGGAWCASVDEAFLVPASPVEVANATGAGDAFAAGVTWGLATGMQLHETAELASRLAAIALASERTVSEHMSEDALIGRKGARP